LASPFSALKSPTWKSGAQQCAAASIVSGEKARLRGGRSQHERPVTLKQNQICNQHSRKTGRFTSRTIKIQNAAVRFSGICALRAESGSLIS